MKIMKSPRLVDLEITTRCNLRCTYCSHFSSSGDVEQDLPKEEWLAFFDELGRCSVMDVCLSGGEAFIREDLTELIEGIVRNRMRFSMLSNGTLITDEIAAFLASTRRCSSVQVSIDGSMPESHDIQRGRGTFEKALQGIRHLQKHALPVTVRVTIHRQNVNDLEAVSKMLLEDMGLPGFSTNAASYLGMCRENKENLLLTAEDRTLAMETLLRLNKKYQGRISAAAGPLAEGRMWLEMEKARREKRESMPGRGFLTGCGCTTNKIGVRADGVIVACCLLPQLELGKINRDNFQEIWQKHPLLNRLRERSSISLSTFEFCKGCPYIHYCTGNCPALAYSIYGTEDHPSPDACLRRFLEAGGKLPNESHS